MSSEPAYQTIRLRRDGWTAHLTFARPERRNALTHAMMVVCALALVQAPRVPLRLAFIGFAFVSSVYYLYARAHAEASDRPLDPRWLARWGGVVLTGLTAWLHLQTLGGRPFGLALHVALAAAALLAATLPPAPART